MIPGSSPLYAEAEALLSDGRWDEVEDLCRRSASRGQADSLAFALLGVVHAKRGNVELAHGFLEEASKPARGPDGPRVAARCIREFLGRDQAAVLMAGLMRTFPREDAFAALDASVRAPHPDALGAWPYMNEIEVIAMQAALRTLSGKVDVLEWGGGHSTFFYVRSLGAGSVWTSIEHHAEWFSRLKTEPQPATGARIDLRLVPNSGPFQDGVDDGDMNSFPEYIRHPRSIASSFRFILVDGRARVECLREGWRLLSRDGILVLHDGERPEYRAGHPRDGYSLEVSNPSLKERKAICFFAKAVETFRSLTAAMRETLPVYVSLAPGIPGSR